MTATTTGHPRPDWLFGDGATRTEKGLAYTVAAVGCAAFVAGGQGLGWSWWQWAVGVALVWDLVGGVVANGLDSAKRFYHSPLPGPAGPGARLMHHPVGFTATHLQPVLAGLVFPGGPWWWGLLWYGWALLGAVVVHRLSRRLQRPAAFAVVAAGVMVAPLVTAPPGMAWLPAVLLLKLVLAHAVPEHLGAATVHGDPTAHGDPAADGRTPAG
jgi:hypothetical protein